MELHEWLCVVLIVLIVWVIYRTKQMSDERKAQIKAAALYYVPVQLGGTEGFDGTWLAPYNSLSAQGGGGVPQASRQEKLDRILDPLRDFRPGPPIEGLAAGNNWPPLYSVGYQ